MNIYREIEIDRYTHENYSKSYEHHSDFRFSIHLLHLYGLHLKIIYIYSHPQTDLFRSIRTHQCG